MDVPNKWGILLNRYIHLDYLAIVKSLSCLGLIKGKLVQSQNMTIPQWALAN
jgi:hypothetical protein